MSQYEHPQQFNHQEPFYPEQHFQGNGNFEQPFAAPFYPGDIPHSQSPIGEDKKGNRPEWFMQLKSHGGKAALQAETSETTGNWHTVNLECARKDPSDPNGKRFDWSRKMVLQLTRNELPVFTAVMLGYLPAVRFDNHGDLGKWVEVINQGKSFFFKLGGKDMPMFTIPVPVQEAFMIGTLALGQYTRNFHGMSHEASLSIIRSMSDQLYANNLVKQPQARNT